MNNPLPTTFEAYAVESAVMRPGVDSPTPVRIGTARYWTMSRAKADAHAAEIPGRTVRVVPLAEIPDKVRKGFEDEIVRLASLPQPQV